MNKTKRRVLFLTNIPSPYRVDFFNELGKRCELTVLFERKSSDDRDSHWHSHKFINFKSIFLKGIKKGSNKALCPGVIKYLRKDLYDLIIIGGYATPTGMLAINYMNFKRIPFVLNTDGGIINKNENPFKVSIKKYFISKASYWLSTGIATTSYLEHYGADIRKTFVYPFTTLLYEDILNTPLRKEEKKNIKKKLNIVEEKVILSVGQYTHRKGFDILLNAGKEFPENVGVYIIGGTPTEDYLELKNRLGLKNVHFVDFISKEELKEYYMLSDIFVLPTREDIWGLVVNEAMAYGLPVITTDKCIAGLELVENYKNGVIIPVNDSKILSKVVNELIEDSSLLKSMSQNNLKKIEKYTIENMAQEHIDIFNCILDKRNNTI
ncbi:glycosyltransferase family 4 protein [Cytobacillus oceanisediminis]|uniref:glycosyltransferase family 4 protein n=1 Tax=Cytobacillus oceanisediminis TaxID=665099 RepID=UPI001D150F2A|nr:glycosyltransferase family 4 protein [Cytobacillus oceanisediminis]MCC3648462.1 glycosyltransferase family 4 protein [Cytobacillus oceanisediminis]